MCGALTFRSNPPRSIVVYENKLNAELNAIKKQEMKNEPRTTERVVGSIKSWAAECTVVADLEVEDDDDEGGAATPGTKVAPYEVKDMLDVEASDD